MNLTDTQVLLNFISKHQYGGIIDMDKIKKSFDRQTTTQDATANKPPPKLQPRLANKDMFGRTVPQAPDQGTIHLPYNKSVREQMLSGLDKVDKDGQNMVAGIVTEPLKAGLRLLRPDKYFENVQSDADVGPALAHMGLDAAQLAPVLEGIRAIPEEALNKQFIPFGNRRILPRDMSFQTEGNSVKAMGSDGKVYGNIDLVDRNPTDWDDNVPWVPYNERPVNQKMDWMMPDRVDVHPDIRGNRLQDVLYQKGIEVAKSQGKKGLVSGDVVSEPEITDKLQSRFNNNFLQRFKEEDELPANNLVQLLGHKNPNVVEDWLQNYRDNIPKTLPVKKSINQLIGRIPAPPNFGGTHGPDIKLTADDPVEAGNQWMNQWKNHPIIQDRINTNNQQLIRRGEIRGNDASVYGSHPIDASMDINVKRPNAQERAAIQKNNQDRDVYGLYYPDAGGEPSILQGKAFYIKGPQATSTSIHEGTHQLTNSSYGYSGQTERMLQAPFGNYRGIAESINDAVEKNTSPYWGTIEENGKTKLANHMEYLSRPQEVHARVNELRKATNLTPERQIDEAEARAVLDHVKTGTSVVDSKFGDMIRDPKALRDLFNKMFSVATPVAGVSLLPRNNDNK